MNCLYKTVGIKKFFDTSELFIVSLGGLKSTVIGRTGAKVNQYKAKAVHLLLCDM